MERMRITESEYDSNKYNRVGVRSEELKFILNMKKGDCFVFKYETKYEAEKAVVKIYQFDKRNKKAGKNIPFEFYRRGTQVYVKRYLYE